MIERIHLTILREIDRTGSLTSAATSLNLTQPALSHTIRKFEERCGTPLWEKQGRGIRLTQAGDYMLSAAQRILPRLENADEHVRQFARGDQGALRIGMECHPCYQWLLKVVNSYLQQWPGIDLDVKQQFQFGGMAALFNYDIDILVTPDPLNTPGVTFVPVFDYEQVLLVANDHPLTKKTYVTPRDLKNETLLTYPVTLERLDIYTEFLKPANCQPKKHKTIEATEILLAMVAASRGVAALPRWLVEEHALTMPIKPLKLGQHGIAKSIHLGVRNSESSTPHLMAFLNLAKEPLMKPEVP